MELAIETQEETVYPVIKVEEPEYCKLKVYYEGDPVVVSEKIDEAIAALRKVKVPGFRQGKAPDQAIKIRLRPQINQFVAREMASLAIDDIIFETNFKIIGTPNFKNVDVKDRKFTCDIELSRKPDVTLGEFKFEIPKPARVLDEEALAEKSLLNLRKRVGETLPYEEDDFVEMGDEVTFSFTATIDVDGQPEPFDGSISEGEMYTIGTDRWGNWDSNLIGMKAGETKEFDFTFTTGPEELVGKSAHFSVDIHMGIKRKPHPINEDFYKIMGVENIEDLMNKLRVIAKSSIERSENESIRKQVAMRLVKSHDFEIPKFLTEDEAVYIAAQAGNIYEPNVKPTVLVKGRSAGATTMVGAVKDLSDDDKKQLLEVAEEQVRLSLILDSIRDAEPDSVLSDSEAHNSLANHLTQQGQDPNALFKNPAARPQLLSLLSTIKDEFTLQWVASQSTIIE